MPMGQAELMRKRVEDAISEALDEGGVSIAELRELVESFAQSPEQDLSDAIAALDENTAKRLLWGICAELNDHFNGRPRLSPQLERIRGMMEAKELRHAAGDD